MKDIIGEQALGQERRGGHYGRQKQYSESLQNDKSAALASWCCHGNGTGDGKVVASLWHGGQPRLCPFPGAREIEGDACLLGL
jgi:hypothetical protein